MSGCPSDDRRADILDRQLRATRLACGAADSRSIRSPRHGANTRRPAKAGRHRLDREQDASAALSGRDVAGGDLVFVSGEGCEDFGLLGLRNLGEVQGPSEFRCDLIEFCGGDPQVPVGLFKAERRLAWLGGRELEGPTRNVADPQRSHEFEAGQPSQALGVPFLQLRVLGLLADDGVLHDGVAEVIHHRRDGEDAAQPLV
jgi:hypothetical protein